MRIITATRLFFDELQRRAQRAYIADPGSADIDIVSARLTGCYRCAHHGADR
jgi:hypothetical protein